MWRPRSVRSALAAGMRSHELAVARLEPLERARRAEGTGEHAALVVEAKRRAGVLARRCEGLRAPPGLAEKRKLPASEPAEELRFASKPL